MFSEKDKCSKSQIFKIHSVQWSILDVHASLELPPSGFPEVSNKLSAPAPYLRAACN